MPTTPHLFCLAVTLVALTACNGPTVPDDSGSTDDSAEPVGPVVAFGWQHPDCAVPLPDRLPQQFSDYPSSLTAPIAEWEDESCFEVDNWCHVDDPIEPGRICMQLDSSGLGFEYDPSEEDLACSRALDAWGLREGCWTCAGHQAIHKAACCAGFDGVDCREYPYPADGVQGSVCMQHSDCEPGLLCGLPAQGDEFGVCQCPGLERSEVVQEPECQGTPASLLATCDDGGVEVCDDGVDNDGDGLVDALDRVDCVKAYFSAHGPYAPDDRGIGCNSGTDYDEDGLLGCDDPSCIGRCEVCDDGTDNDGDGLVDCADHLDCFIGCAEECFNGVDDNGDGRVDLADPRCSWWGDQGRLYPESICDDGLDNDDDGFPDELDPDCAPAEICDDGIDNDIDTFIDQYDPDCWSVQLPEDCTDGRDNDHDGLADCYDRDCDGSCPEDCDDGADNDGNGLIDCEDAACTTAYGCFEDCTDGIDNDADGTTDCWDDDCWGPECVGATRTTVSGFGLRARQASRLLVVGDGSTSNWERIWEARDAVTASSVAANVEVADGYGGVLTSCSMTVEEMRVVNSDFRRSTWHSNRLRWPEEGTRIRSVGKQLARPVEVQGAFADCADADAALPDRLLLDAEGVWTTRPESRLWPNVLSRGAVWPEEQYFGNERLFLSVEPPPWTCGEANYISSGSDGVMVFVDATSRQWSADVTSQPGEPFYAPAP